MNGILIIDKQKNMTSRDVVNIVSKKLNTKKVGHTGTLDPIATGVLVICVGKYTKLVEILTSLDKTYEAEIVLGIKTDTADITGKILEEKDVYIEKDDILKTLEKFKKEYYQQVPIYSAIKINGKKLYEYARENKDIELPTRKVKINSIELISDIKHENNKTIFSIRCEVSKGTYIRSLITDIATYLNTIGTMSNLKRIKQGKFSIENAITLKELENSEVKFIDINDVFEDYKIVSIEDEMFNKIRNGAIIDNIYKSDIVVFKYNEEIVSIYKNYEKCKGKMKPWKNLY